MINRDPSVVGKLLELVATGNSSPQIEDALPKILKCGNQVPQASPEALMSPSDGCQEAVSRALLQQYGWTLGMAKEEGECLFLSIWTCILEVMGTMLPAELRISSFSIDEAARMLRWFAASIGVTLSMNMER